ncbi:DUF3006 domain-containing protein [Halobacillus campisalis]|uniref:DUF3006 domain-containing protein n=1 Tax=Halobacillus campisalis TaxID=435909 RepID=A0ABW2K126_9BACI|nr:DUF3006 domain-containing protein [Halobacillus campisalis]
MKAVLDRIEENQYAVLLVEENTQEFILNKNELPEGSKPHDWFEVTIENDKITSLKVDPEFALAQEQKVKSKRDRLKKRSQGSKFKRE